MVTVQQTSRNIDVLLDAVRVGVWTLDLATLTLVCSGACKTNYGRTPEDTFTYDDLARSVHPDDHPRWRAAVEASIADGSDLDIEYRALWPDGVDHWVHVRATCLTDDNGRVIMLHGVSLDVDARKRAEERVRVLDAIAEATRTIADPLQVMATASRMLALQLGVTRCAYADVNRDNDTFTIRADWTQPGVPSSAGEYSLDTFGREAALAMRAGQTLIVDDTEALANGPGMFRAIGIRAVICCPLVKEHKLVAMMAVHNREPRVWRPWEVALVEQVVERCWADIERVRTSAKLREQDQRKDEFLATLAHELRNPLAPLRAGLYVIAHERLSPQADKARVIMQRQLEHTVRLVDDLLDVSRIRVGTIELRREPFQLASVIEHAVETSRPLAAAAAHTLTVNLRDEPLWLVGDPVRIAQVLTNVLNNAIKYTPRGGRIAIEAARDGHEVAIAVTDTGIGIHAELLPKIFDLFVRGGDATAGVGGLGIGLSLARRLVEMHGGTLVAQSAGERKGSRFTLRLPLMAGVPEPRPAPKLAVASAPAPAKIMIVDDNVDGAETLATLLAMRGHATRVAYDGPSALADAPSFSPDIVFLDIGLPGMSGLEVARALRAGGSKALLVALTGWGGAENERKSREAGFDLHVVKPIDEAQLADVVATRRNHA